MSLVKYAATYFFVHQIGPLTLWKNIFEISNNLDKYLWKKTLLLIEIPLCAPQSNAVQERFFIPPFHKNSHPTQWKVLNFNLFQDKTCCLITEKSYYIPLSKQPILFTRTKLSISNEESYLARSKQSLEFHKETVIFLCMNINFLNWSGL